MDSHQTNFTELQKPRKSLSDSSLISTKSGISVVTFIPNTQSTYKGHVAEFSAMKEMGLTKRSVYKSEPMLEKSSLVFCEEIVSVDMSTINT